MNDRSVAAVWTLIICGWTVILPLAWRVTARRSLPVPGGGRMPARGIVLAWSVNAAAWAAMSAVDVDPLGVGESIVLLTAAHFTYAGAGVTALLVAAGARHAVWFHQVAMATVAAGLGGIDSLTWLQPVGTAALVGVLCHYSWLAWMHPWPNGARWRRALRTVSCVAWCRPLYLALTWALAQAGAHSTARTIDSMVAHHGAIQAVVVFAGLLAFDGQPGVDLINQPTNRETFDAHIHTTH
jgi:hypothetical protein